MKMFVRLALEEEEDVFVELARMAAENVPHVPFSDTRIRETFRGYIERASPTIFFVDYGRDVIGFLMATMSRYSFADGLYTTQEVLFVRPDKRGSRAAVLLAKELVRWSEQLGALEITGGNDHGLFTDTIERLLSSQGFERVGVFMRRIGSAANG